MTDSWKEAILEHIPHGHEGELTLNWEDAIALEKILIKNGYAVCITGGDMDDELRVSWLYAGTVESLDYADYEQVVFTNIDYINDYPEAYYAQYNEDDDNNNEEPVGYVQMTFFDDSAEDEVEALPTKPEVSE